MRPSFPRPFTTDVVVERRRCVPAPSRAVTLTHARPSRAPARRRIDPFIHSFARIHSFIRHSAASAARRRRMLTFCPTCGNVLSLERETDDDARLRAEIATSPSPRSGSGGGVRLRCASCPYAYEVTSGVKQRVEHAKKTLDDVLGGEEAWKNVDKTSATCPKCAHDSAYFMQIQIRSADEPMSTFYKCCRAECGHQWREG